MNRDIAMTVILDALQVAEDKHPDWPTDPVHASAILVEEAGELTQACLDYSYREADEEKAVKEAAQCGAMAIRFLMGVGLYTRTKEY